MDWQLAARCQFDFRGFETIKAERNCQTAARCQFTISYELATGNWQLDANLILEDFNNSR